MSTTGCCRGLSAKDCIARPNGCFDEPERVCMKPYSYVPTDRELSSQRDKPKPKPKK